MIAKFALILLVVAVASANPATKGPWRWTPRHLTVSPNQKAWPFEEIVKSIVPQKPKYPSGTVRVAGCGTAPLAPPVDAVIVGGDEATPHEFPWACALFIGPYFCTCSLISDTWVVTAAHCTDGQVPADAEVVLGAHNVNDAEPTQVSIIATRLIVHENYNSVTIHNDISLIELSSPVTFNDYIQPICLPTGADLGAGVTVTPSGWGKKSDAAISISPVLRKVDVPTITRDTCAAYYGAIVSDDMLCIDGANGKGTCNGDSGGPLNYKVGGITELRGITSFGSSAGCESGAPDSFTRVNHFLGWIQDNSGVTIL